MESGVDDDGDDGDNEDDVKPVDVKHETVSVGSDAEPDVAEPDDDQEPHDDDREPFDDREPDVGDPEPDVNVGDAAVGHALDEAEAALSELNHSPAAPAPADGGAEMVAEPPPGDQDPGAMAVLPAAPEHHGEDDGAAPADPPEARQRSSGPRVNSTPTEILQRIEPCSIFRLRLNFGDHRFTVETVAKEKDPRWIAPFNKGTFSRTFKVSRDWKSSLKAVHEHMWKKWKLSQDVHPLARGMVEQMPGEIDPQIFTDLEPIIDAMPAAKH